MPYEPITNFKDSTLPVGVDLGKKLVTKDYLLEVYGSILENSPASGLVVTPELWVWGRNDSGQLGINASGNRNTPVTTFAGGNNWKSVATGALHTTAIKTDGSLWTWGNNGHGELGINLSGVATERTTPVTTFAGGNDWKSTTGGYGFTAAVKTDGSLWTWGRNVEGQLGTNDTTNRSTPVTTFAGGNNWKQVAAGYWHSAAIKTDGSLWTWGQNSNGELGTNDTTNRSTPVTTFAGGTDWKFIGNRGRFNALAIKTNGSLWVWGRGAEGQLGTNDNTQRNTPVTTFAGGNNWKSASMGDRHTTATKTDGSLWTWGYNLYGQLGVNDTTSRSTPVTTFAGGNNWKSAVCGGYTSSAIKTDGSLWIWGNNNSGQLGINASGNRSTPVTTFAGGNNWKSVHRSSNLFGHTIAIKSIDYI